MHLSIYDCTSWLSKMLNKYLECLKKNKQKKKQAELYLCGKSENAVNKAADFFFPYSLKLYFIT